MAAAGPPAPPAPAPPVVLSTGPVPPVVNIPISGVQLAGPDHTALQIQPGALNHPGAQGGPGVSVDVSGPLNAARVIAPPLDPPRRHGGVVTGPSIVDQGVQPFQVNSEEGWRNLPRLTVGSNLLSLLTTASVFSVLTPISAVARQMIYQTVLSLPKGIHLTEVLPIVMTVLEGHGLDYKQVGLFIREKFLCCICMCTNRKMALKRGSNYSLPVWWMTGLKHLTNPEMPHCCKACIDHAGELFLKLSCGWQNEKPSMFPLVLTYLHDQRTTILSHTLGEDGYKRPNFQPPRLRLLDIVPLEYSSKVKVNVNEWVHCDVILERLVQHGWLTPAHELRYPYFNFQSPDIAFDSLNPPKGRVAFIDTDGNEVIVQDPPAIIPPAIANVEEEEDQPFYDDLFVEEGEPVANPVAPSPAQPPAASPHYSPASPEYIPATPQKLSSVLSSIFSCFFCTF